MDKVDRILRDMKYARIIELISEKEQISLEEAMDMLYSSKLFELIDDGNSRFNLSQRLVSCGRNHTHAQ